MKITASMLEEIAAMPAEAMAASIRFLAVQLGAEERKKAFAAQRQSRYRNAQSNAVVDVTTASPKRHCDAEVTPLARVEYNNNLPNLEGSKINPLVPPSPSKPKPSEPDGFGEFWEVYPKRDGNTDRKGAAKAFGAALKRTTIKTLLDGARAYAEHCKAKGKLQTEYVKQARSWLNGDLWTEWASKATTTQNQSVEQRIPVIEDSPAWQEWKALKPSLTARDIWLQDGKRARGWYFPTEFPQVSVGAMQ